MSHLALVVHTAIAILAVVLLIVRFKFNPVVSLVIGSAYLGLATGIGVEKTIDAIMKGFGDIMAEIGLLIAFGVLMGSILQRTGAIQRLVETLLKVFGAKRMPYAMSLTIATFLQSIYVDVLLVISAPLARRLATKIGKKGTGRMAVAMAIGLDCGLALTVPGVGALGLAGSARSTTRQNAVVRRSAGDSDRGDRGDHHAVRLHSRVVERSRDEQAFIGRADTELLDDAGRQTLQAPRRTLR